MNNKGSYSGALAAIIIIFIVCGAGLVFAIGGLITNSINYNKYMPVCEQECKDQGADFYKYLADDWLSSREKCSCIINDGTLDREVVRIY